MGEALIDNLGARKWRASSAGADRAWRVNSFELQALTEAGIALLVAPRSKN
jgi:protein-tyrosine-phosphatase